MVSCNPQVILGSSSPYRRALLSRLAIDFEVCSPQIDETPLAGESPPQTAMRLALEKARAIALHYPDAVIIGADQVATVDGVQIGKAGDFERALAQLQSMRGKQVTFHSALCVLDARNQQAKVQNVMTQVRFRDLPDDDLAAYLRIEQPYDCAGSAKVEGLGITLLEHVQSDDPTALIGLPLIALSELLRHAGIDVWAKGRA